MARLKIPEFLRSVKSFNHDKPEHISDPVAKLTSWKPLVEGGSNFKTHKLVYSDESVNFVATFGSCIFSLLFICFSFAFFVSNYLPELSFFKDAPSLPTKIISLIFLGASLYLMHLTFRPRNFDLVQKIYRNSWFKPNISLASIDTYHCIKFSDMHALQIIEEYIKEGDYSTELNLILKNGQRENIIDHSNKDSIKHDADKLSKVLGVPVWSGLIEDLDLAKKLI